MLFDSFVNRYLKHLYYERSLQTPTCDGQTDGQTDGRTDGHRAMASTARCYASRGKNSITSKLNVLK